MRAGIQYRFWFSALYAGTAPSGYAMASRMPRPWW